jgi:small-conductance mechanosensitive channel
MRKFFRYAYEGYAPVPYAVNPVRWLEAVSTKSEKKYQKVTKTFQLLCIICLALAVYLTVSMPFMHLVFKVILVVTAGAFTAITIIDIISNTFRNPIYWNTWTLFAITAALFFFLCVGLLIATGLHILLIIAIVFNAITAIVFLLDAFLVLK